MEREMPLVWRLISVVTGLLLMLALAAGPSTAAESEFGPEDIERAKEAYPADSIADQVSRLETRAWVEFPDTFAGLWLKDGDYSEIFVSFSENAAESLDQIVRLEGFDEIDRLRLAEAGYSIAELEDVQARLVQHRDFLQGQRTSDGSPPETSKFNVNIDLPTNTLQIIAEGEAKEYASQFAKSQIDIPYEIVDEDPGSPSCGGTWNCGAWLRGGLGVRYNIPSAPGWTGTCTTGFTARKGSARPILSAAHCGNGLDGLGPNDNGNQRFYGPNAMGTLFGSVQASRIGGRSDVERISVGNGHHAHPWIYRNHSTPSWGITSRGTWAGFTLYQRFCRSGITTGRRCGVAVTKFEAPWWVTGANRFLGINAPQAGGDSGGPTYQQHKAIGIHSGGHDTYSISGHIEYAEDHLGVTIDTM